MLDQHTENKEENGPNPKMNHLDDQGEGDQLASDANEPVIQSSSEPDSEEGEEVAVNLNIDRALNDAISGISERSGSVKTQTMKSFETFEQADLDESLLSAVHKLGWVKPTKVQSFCLPYTLLGQDVAGFAQTGTGKTGVFLISTAHRILQARKENGEDQDKSGPFAVILVPTRELAVQIQEEAAKLFDLLDIKSLAVYGGMSWEEQARSIKAGVDIIVATPGRLKDFFEKKLFLLDKTAMFVCDEVDRMFDMGFIDDVEYFFSHLSEACQKLLFSATTNEKVKELAFEYLNKPEYISVNPEEVTPENIEQKALICEVPQKLHILLGLLEQHQPHRAIIFANTKLTAAWLQYKLKGNGLQVDLITGDLPQPKRIKLINRIKLGQIKILIATDVASRGLHIDGVSHVYNFDLPDDPANYVHRIGRTARAGAKGESYTLVCEEYASNLLAIQDLLGKDAPKSSWPDESLLSVKDKAGNPFEDNFGRGYPEPSFEQRDSRGRNTRQGKSYGKSRDHKRGNYKGKPRRDYSKKGKQTKEPTGLFAMFKRFFGLLFGRRKKAKK